MSRRDACQPALRCAVLAGGAGSRLGGAKPGFAVGGRPLISYPLAAARQAGLVPVVVAKASTRLPGLDCEVLIEPEEPLHPLAGVLAALEHVGEPVVVTPCDLPLLPAAVLAKLATAEREPCVVAGDGRLQPLLGRYPPSVAGALRAGIAAGVSATSLARSLPADVLGLETLTCLPATPALFNVNTPEDAAVAERSLRAGGSSAG